MTIIEALTAARTHIPPAEARLLLSQQLQCSTAWLEAHREEGLSPEQQSTFHAQVNRRATGEPIAYLLGKREFYGRDFAVTPDVLIPRPETELLVDIVVEKVGAGKTAMSRFAANTETAEILDLGTGSGCLAITLALELPMAQIMAVDSSFAALTVACDNALRLEAGVTFIESDWFTALPATRFDLIVANPPYIAANDPHLNQGDLRFEPVNALTDHADGLAAIRQIATRSPHHLNPKGWLFLEHGYDQAAAVHDLLVEAGFSAIEHHCDLAGIVRVSGGCIA